MKLSILFLVLFSFVSVFAADTTNVAVNKEESPYHVMYYGPATMASDGGTDNCTTQWMRIDFLDLATNPGTIQIWTGDLVGTEDVNGYIEFSNSDTSSRFIALNTDPDLDAIATTVKIDTVVVALGKRCYGAKYMRLKFDGQTGNPHSTVVHWYVTFLKPDRPDVKRRADIGDCL